MSAIYPQVNSELATNPTQQLDIQIYYRIYLHSLLFLAAFCTWHYILVVSMGGSNELVECFCGGAVAEGGSGAVVQFVGDGVEVGLVAGDGGSFGKVAADKSVGIFVCSSLPGAMGVSEEHLHAGILGEALVAGHFWALVPCQCSHRTLG